MWGDNWGDVISHFVQHLPSGLFLLWLLIFNRYHALTRDPGDEGSTVYSTIWDSNMMHGCECDDGYQEPDCLFRVSLLPLLFTQF